MNRLSNLLTAVAAATASTAATAHDFFLMPEAFNARRSESVVIRATVGSNFPTPEIVVTADRVEQLWVRGSGRPQIKVSAAEQKALPLQVTGAQAGLLIAAVKSKPRDVEYAEDRIPLILEEYRVAPEAAAAVGRLPRPRTWKVNSRRFAKTIVCVQRCTGGASSDQPVGGALEFVTQANRRDHFVLLSNGRALGDYPVDLVGTDGKRQHLKTNGQGIVHLSNAAKGSMMLFAAVLTPPRGQERFTLDLSTLTFSR